MTFDTQIHIEETINETILDLVSFTCTCCGEDVLEVPSTLGDPTHCHECKLCTDDKVGFCSGCGSVVEQDNDMWAIMEDLSAPGYEVGLAQAGLQTKCCRAQVVDADGDEIATWEHQGDTE